MQYARIYWYRCDVGHMENTYSEGNNMTNESTEEFDARSEIEALKLAQATQAATMAGAQATQAATMAGAQATQAAAQAGVAATNAAAQAGTVAMVIAGSVGATVGLFLGMAIARK